MKKNKLNLINSYVYTYRIIAICESKLLYSSTDKILLNFLLEKSRLLKNAIEQEITLKKYGDNSFYLLKEELSNITPIANVSHFKTANLFLDYNEQKKMFASLTKKELSFI